MRSMGEELEGSANVKSNTPPYIHQILVKRVKGGRRKAAVLVGLVKGGYIYIGWSKTNFKSGDEFNREYGIKLALERTKAIIPLSIPQSIFEDILKFEKRCLRYFQNARHIMDYAFNINKL